MNKRTSIYVLKDPRNNFIRYVGKTTQVLKYRLAQHLNEKSNHKRATWIKSLKKLGLIPIIEEIDFCNWVQSSELEIQWIEKFKFLGEDLTNMTAGGDGTLGVIPTKEQLELRSWIMKEKYKNGFKHPMLGKTHSKEVREKISKTHKGKKVSDEFREKRRKIMLGSKRDKTAIIKTAKSNMIKIIQLSLDDKPIQIFNSLKEANKVGFTSSKLIDCLKGRKEKYKGYRWMYFKDFEELPLAEEFKKNPKLYDKYV